MKKLKQIIANKNTVTILGIALILVVLYVFYNWRINQQTSMIDVPYALQTIPARTKITSDMVGTLSIPNASIKGNVITKKSSLYSANQDFYVNINTSVPAGSMFYKEQVVRQEDLPDSFLVDIKDGYVPYNFGVNIASTYGNSMYPGNYVDVYFKGINAEGLLMVGKLIENVEILAVKDSGGRHVFEATSEARTPSQIIFAVTNEIHLILRKAEYIRNVEIILVPNTVSFKLDEDETTNTVIHVTSETIKEYINSKSIEIDEIELEDENNNEGLVE